MCIRDSTLTMHIALALKKKVVALFGPTSANEIYDYGRLVKIVPNLDCVCCYIKEKCNKKPNCMEMISVEEVLEKIESLLKRGDKNKKNKKFGKKNKTKL